MKAFLFPGQGSQYSGMGNDLTSFSRAYYFFETAREVLGIDIFQVMNGDEDFLKLTENAQPAIYIASYIAFDELIRAGYVPSLLAGHSLGEYTALAAADVYDFETGLYLVRKRGEYISQSVKPGEGTMAAVIGAKIDEIEAAISDIDNVWVANHNSEDQVVISGMVESVRIAIERLKKIAKRVAELKVSGPFHTPLLESAREKMAHELRGIKFRKPRWPIVMNSTGRETTDPEKIRENILSQICGPVLWYDSINRMIQLGAKSFIEVGPQKVLTNLLKRSKSAPCKHFTEIVFERQFEAVGI
ncbi:MULTISPECIES: ACP S-malonyltransferase [Pseudothermotoga]|jgi:[acyl-carrier-protein] S-malonyltransferase|uniref:Malonyl CoA-acyl carrier protein transacylase n=1 Tax=Pseudothermotoga lettingae (strain ATCC BAA-301 / DSM 14385 / NBRC 107922 / TMO) TaxID=416591 RepID=A8F4B3_PSELT|nr:MULTISPECIES: ACP S-malonyltransferase [Pseudothermotoga]ABV32997.1 malonyl CoA-acyl carrier protein transacylase [Pseudothermotoga lettingae TMO]KUK21030.1 MAG: Malonyl CoA-acyl carrier protein transacylase [Pseudothermotoga lettingae]MDI3494223.1 [acyl-carrier-protein] S-malonyltransferase [Pseudothermotoga sp.]MDK2884003.1 [acyl-carrier-protein] S-malonyltransferase [Pseudothermotoga sp.]GLI48001.1 malonyl CoA-acyl carrier protein transacylase [Pseudothermotoga lettingae TMO]